MVSKVCLDENIVWVCRRPSEETRSSGGNICWGTRILLASLTSGMASARIPTTADREHDRETLNVEVILDLPFKFSSFLFRSTFYTQTNSHCGHDGNAPNFELCRVNPSKPIPRDELQNYTKFRSEGMCFILVRPYVIANYSLPNESTKDRLSS